MSGSFIGRNDSMYVIVGTLWRSFSHYWQSYYHCFYQRNHFFISYFM